METPELFEAILADLSRTLRQVDARQVEHLKEAILSADRVFIAGKGRSGLQMKAFAMRLMHLGLTVHVVDDVTTPSIAAADLLLIGSSSGRTASLLRHVDTAKETGTSIATFTGNLESPIAAAAQTLVHIPASNFKAGAESGEESVLVMGSLFEHCLGLVCDLLVIRLKQALGVDESAMNARHANLE
ncbi:MAG: SIS domain-containing protein [Chloroflexota bacterium]|nr:SIS domain-containing protein [Chloroflexota bacterium]